MMTDARPARDDRRHLGRRQPRGGAEPLRPHEGRLRPRGSGGVRGSGAAYRGVTPSAGGEPNGSPEPGLGSNRRWAKRLKPQRGKTSGLGRIFRPSSRATTARRSLRGERRPPRTSVLSETSQRPDSEVGTGVGTPRAFLAPLAHMTHATMRFPLNQAAVNGPGRDRTCDLGIKSPLLYQLSYRPA